MNYQNKKICLHHHYQSQHHGYSLHLHNLQQTLVVHECMCLKNSDTSDYRENLCRDDDKYEWKYNDSYDYLKKMKK